MANEFPGGVCDDDLDTAYLRTPSGELIAVDLGDGSIRWRRAGGGRPIAASREHLLTVPQKGSTDLQLLTAASGEAVTGIAGEAAGLAPDDDNDVEVVDAQLKEGPEGPRISLVGERRYRGGASPPARLKPGEQTQVSLVVDPASGEARPAPAWRGPKVEGLVPVAAGPETLAAGRKHGTTFALKRTPGGGELVLEARDARGQLRWSTSLGPLGSKPPTPLRP